MGLLDILGNVGQAMSEGVRAKEFGPDFRQKWQAYQDQHNRQLLQSAIEQASLDKTTQDFATKNQFLSNLHPGMSPIEAGAAELQSDKALKDRVEELTLSGMSQTQALAKAKDERDAQAATREQKQFDLSSPFIVPNAQAEIASKKANAAHALAAAGYQNAQTKELQATDIPGLTSPPTPGQPSPGTTSPGALPTPGTGSGGGQTNEAFLKTLPPAIADVVKAYAEGRAPVPSGIAMSKPYFQQIMRLVGTYDPTFDLTSYPARVAGRRDFLGGGKSAQTINALNTVIGHMGELSDKGAALDNTSYPAINAIKNWASQQSGAAAPVTFMQNAHGVATELMRTYRQSGAGSTKEIEEWLSGLSPNMSPDQQKGSWQTLATMLEDKLSALQNQANQSLGPAASQVQTVSPGSRKTLDRLEGGQGGTPPRPAGVPGQCHLGRCQPSVDRALMPAWDEQGNPIKAGQRWDEHGNPIGAQDSGPSVKDQLTRGLVESIPGGFLATHPSLLPAAGGITGSLLGAPGGPGGMIAGGALGGIIGESGRKVIEALTGNGPLGTAGGDALDLTKEAALGGVTGAMGAGTLSKAPAVLRAMASRPGVGLITGAGALMAGQDPKWAAMEALAAATLGGTRGARVIEAGSEPLATKVEQLGKVLKFKQGFDPEGVLAEKLLARKQAMDALRAQAPEDVALAPMERPPAPPVDYVSPDTSSADRLAARVRAVEARRRMAGSEYSPAVPRPAPPPVENVEPSGFAPSEPPGSQGVPERGNWTPNQAPQQPSETDAIRQQIMIQYRKDPAMQKVLLDQLDKAGATAVVPATTPTPTKPASPDLIPDGQRSIPPFQHGVAGQSTPELPPTNSALVDRQKALLGDRPNPFAVDSAAVDKAAKYEKLRGKIATTLGKGFVGEQLSPLGASASEGISVVGDPSKGSFDIIQKVGDQVVGGARVRDGHLMMIAGGPKVGSPLSARPIYEKLNELGIDANSLPADEYTKLGMDARNRFLSKTGEQ